MAARDRSPARRRLQSRAHQKQAGLTEAVQTRNQLEITQTLRAHPSHGEKTNAQAYVDLGACLMLLLVHLRQRQASNRTGNVLQTQVTPTCRRRLKVPQLPALHCSPLYCCSMTRIRISKAVRRVVLGHHRIEHHQSDMQGRSCCLPPWCPDHRPGRHKRHCKFAVPTAPDYTKPSLLLEVR